MRYSRPGVYVGDWGEGSWCLLASVTQYRTQYLSKKLGFTTWWIEKTMLEYGGRVLTRVPNTIVFDDKEQAEACADYLNSQSLIYAMKDM